MTPQTGNGDPVRVTTPRDPSSIASLMNNPTLLKEDIKGLEMYVKESLFYKVIFIQDRKGEEKGSMLKVGGPLFLHFFSEMAMYLCRGKLKGKPKADAALYVEKLWTIGLDSNNKGSIQKWMEVKRSNIYCNMQTKFDGTNRQKNC